MLVAFITVVIDITSFISKYLDIKIMICRVRCCHCYVNVMEIRLSRLSRVSGFLNVIIAIMSIICHSYCFSKSGETNRFETLFY